MNAVHVTVSGVLVGKRDNSRFEDFMEAAEPVALIGEGALESPVPSPSNFRTSFFIHDFPSAVPEALDRV